MFYSLKSNTSRDAGAGVEAWSMAGLHIVSFGESKGSEAVLPNASG
jgi:hypothetical protein